MDGWDLGRIDYGIVRFALALALAAYVFGLALRRHRRTEPAGTRVAFALALAALAFGLGWWVSGGLLTALGDAIGHPVGRIQ